MSDLFPDFRDPLFGIIVIIFAIFVISFLTYSFGLVRERNARKEYRKLLKRFEIGALKEDDFVHLYTTYNLSFDSIMLLASSFLHKGDYTKAISVYLTLLDVVEERIKKEELLELLKKSMEEKKARLNSLEQIPKIDTKTLLEYQKNIQPIEHKSTALEQLLTK